MTWNEANLRCPEGIGIACHLTEGVVAFSGKADTMSDFLEVLKEEGRFIKEVDTNQVPFHSPYMLKAAKEYRNALEKVYSNKRLFLIDKSDRN